MHSIETRSLTKSFGGVVALDGVTFSVGSGEIFGFLGPNGAGKSTTMMILTTLLKPTSGSATISGHDVACEPKKVRRHIGYVQQETTVDEYLTGRENLVLQARLNHIPRREVDSRIDEVLGLIELEDKQDDAVVTYSGGMRKRLDIAGGLLHRPAVLFLDEPTVGLDIQTRRKIWEYIRRIHDEYSMTIFLTTHYMEEADQLCDRIGIIDGGKIRVIDSPSSMKDAMGSDAISLAIGGDGDAFSAGLGGIAHISKASRDGQKFTLFAPDGARAIPQVFELASRLGVAITSISLAKPTLDDVFISYTGRDINDGGTYDRRREHAKMRGLRA